MQSIDNKYWQIIRRVLVKYAGNIEWVKLFGSRARGDAKLASDIDLAVAGSKEVITKLALEFDDSKLPYTFDIIDYNRQTNEKLKQAIDQDGKLIFSSKGGASIMTKMQIEMKQADYHRALERLQLALTKEPDADDMYLDATIQRFEFCFELAWKLMKV